MDVVLYLTVFAGLMYGMYAFVQLLGPQPNQTKEEAELKGKGCLKQIGVFIGLVIVLAVCNEATKSPEDRERSTEQDKKLSAYVFAKEYVRQNISSPSTAVFGEMTESTIEKRSDNVYYVAGYLDAQNRYGATVRMNYNCEIVLKGENAQGRNFHVTER